MYVKIDHHDAYNVIGDGDVTFEAWIRPGINQTSLSGEKHTIFSRGANFKIWISSGITSDAWLTTSLDPDHETGSQAYFEKR